LYSRQKKLKRKMECVCECVCVYEYDLARLMRKRRSERESSLFEMKRRRLKEYGCFLTRNATTSRVVSLN
jgi:hypothetical protein